MKLKTVALKSVKPYANNPRRNDGAVEAVAESIRQCGYVAPIIVDEDMVILAGHTRYKALTLLGWDRVQVAVAEGLTEKQKRKYRILDNKTNELAGWDAALLGVELEGLDFDGFDFGLLDAVEPPALGDKSESKPNGEVEKNLADGAKELDLNEFSDERFQCECPRCGFRYNP